MADPTGARSRFSWRRLLPLVLIGAAAIGFTVFGGPRYLSFSALASNRAALIDWVAQWGAAAPLIYIAIYAGLTALSVPGAALLTITGGLLFGLWFGTLWAMIGATIGASAIFLAARLGLAGLAERAGPRAARLEAGFRANAFSYLLALRLVPVFPFWLVNLAAGAAGIGLPTYLAATFVGIAPGAFVYAGLGNGLGAVIAEGRTPDLAIAFRPAILLPLLGLALLALAPIAYRRWRGSAAR